MSKSTNRTPIYLCIAVVLLFAACIIPLLWVGLYNHPSNDDFLFGAQTAAAWRTGGSLLHAAAQTVEQIYNSWQGTFAAVFLFAFQPAVFGDGLYWLCTPILLGCLTAAFLFFFWAALGVWLQVRRPLWISSALLLELLCIQLMPCPVQSLFWWNGSVYYTLFFAFSLALLATVLLALHARGKLASIVLTAVSLLLAVVVGGGNYISALVSLLLLAALAVWQIDRRSRKSWGVLLPLLGLGSALAVSAFAPGTELRKLAYGDHLPSVTQALDLSVGYTLEWAQKWPSLLLTAGVVCVCLLLVPSLLRLRFRFRRPWLVLLGSAALFYAQFLPTAYGMASDGAGRNLDIFFFLFVLLIALNAVYSACWLARRSKDLRGWLRHARRCPRTTAAVCGLALLLSAYAYTALPETLRQQDGLTTLTAYSSLLTGEAQQYDQEARQRETALNDPAQKNLAFPAYTVQPVLLFYSDLSSDPNYAWSSLPMARFYQKTSVRLVDKTEQMQAADAIAASAE